jgi:hypothetical protein
MSTKMHIKSSERGVIRVFHIDLPREAIERFTTQAGTGEWPLQYALGAKALRNSFVEVIDLRDLGDMSFSDYLVKAHDVSGDAFDAMRTQLDGLKGHALVLPSQAFDQTEQDLVIGTPLRWLGTFNEPKPAGRGPAVKSASASRRDGGAGAPQRPAKKNAGPNAGVIIGILVLVAIAIIVAKFTLF